jgi:cobalt-zinc-cadmium efflux system outer membrane protein
LDARQIAEAEYSRVVVERGKALVERDARMLAVRQAETALATLLGVSGPIVPRDTLVPTNRDRMRYDSLVTLALSRRPDVAAARANADVVAADQKLQEAIAHPDYALSFDYSMQQTVPLYGVSIQVPIPQYNRNQGERAKAAVRQSQARLLLDAVVLTARADVRRAFDALESSRNTLARFEDIGNDGILRRALAAKTSAEFAYRNGATSLLELLDSERSYNDVYRAYVDAVTQFNKSAAQLDEALGTLPERM